MAKQVNLNGQVTEQNPWGIDNVPYDAPIVYFVDALMALAKKNGSKSRVETTKDWQTIEFIWKGFSVLYPKTTKEFLEKMKTHRLHLKNALGTNREGEALVQHTLEVPVPFYHLVNTIFPDQKWDRKFTQSIVKVLPQLQAAEKL